MSDISKGNNMGTTQNDNAQASAPPVDHIVTTEHSAVIRGQALDYTATTGTMDNAQASAPPVDHIVTTEHSAVIRGQALDYTATTGTMVVETAGKKCEIFFTAYTVDEDESTAGRASSARRSGTAGRASAADRPLTFVFNGGPGSSSEWMHMGFFGPRRIACDVWTLRIWFSSTRWARDIRSRWKARSWRTSSAMKTTIGQWVISSGCMSQGMAAGVRQNISPASPTARSARLDWASICPRNTRWG